MSSQTQSLTYCGNDFNISNKFPISHNSYSEGYCHRLACLQTYCRISYYFHPTFWTKIKSSLEILIFTIFRFQVFIWLYDWVINLVWWSEHFFLFWELSIMTESPGVIASFICERYFVEQTLDMVLFYREILMPTFSFNGRAVNWSLWRVMMLMMLIDNFWRNFSTFLSSTVKISSPLWIIHTNNNFNY